MALQFQPPNNIPQKKTSGEMVMETINSLPALMFQYQNLQRQRKTEDLEHQVKMAQLELQKREAQGRFGTGEPAPMTPQSLQPPVMGFPGSTMAPAPQLGMENQTGVGAPGLLQMGGEPLPETAEEKLKRMGTQAYAALNPTTQQYGTYIMGADGTPQFLSLPAGYKPAPSMPSPTPILNSDGTLRGTTFGKPTVLPKPDASTTKDLAAAAETETIVNDSVRELERIELLNEKSRGGLFGQIAQAAESAYDPDKPSEKFKNTADVVNTLKGLVSVVLKSTFGAQLSDGEREYLNEVYGASVKLSREERAIAIKKVKKILQGKLAAAKSRAGEPMAETPTDTDNDPLGIR